MQPPKLLQDLCVVRVPVKNPPVSRFGGVVLVIKSTYGRIRGDQTAHIFLLLMNMPYLEPDVLLSEGPRRVCHDIFKALNS